ncbi:hypothetical protein ABU614_15065 [Lysobacter firmicutimachus]|uniref:Uncharacterized protein n=1 Tax=Lysobacter firmicutimachus TaxID=1792846 RepID=A0AAU8MR05_9GAMM
MSIHGKRQFLHSYTDIVPDLQFVKVTLHEDPHFTGVGATFSLERPAEMEENVWDLIDSHFRRLKLIDRYDERSNDEVAEILSDCRVFLNAGGANLQEFLKGRSNDRRETYGANHWIAVLMNTMAEHPNLKNWVHAA